MIALYNEIDPKAAAWLRALIDAGHIAPGIVDERSIEDLTPEYLLQFTQVHLFAGIGVWSYSLRAAGWPDDRPVWTGSFPCQPFSAAGKGDGFADERHLWPSGHWLIDQCRPDVFFGEQVASKDGLGWFDLVQADMEGSGYACGAVDLCAAGVGAPHIRQRLWWFAERLEHTESDGRQQWRAEPSGWSVTGGRASGRLGNGNQSGLEGQRGRHQAESGRDHPRRPVAEAGGLERLADAGGGGRNGRGEASEQGEGSIPGPSDRNADASFREPERHLSDGAGASLDDRLCDVAIWPGPVNGLWGDADWLFCRDGKWRPVEPGTFPLAHGVAHRVGLLRGAGNAIVAPAAEAFIRAYLDTLVK